jgi:hypothetical protein
MTSTKATVLASAALLLGFTLGMQARSRQASADNPIQLVRVDHVSVFVRSVEKTAEMHKLLLGADIPKFASPPKPPLYPAAEFNWDKTSTLRYGHVVLPGGTRIELQEGVGPSPSRWSDFLAKHGQGIEHLGFVVPNVQEALARFQKAGGKLIMGGCEGCTAHVDMRESLGYIVELMPAPKQ